MKTLLLCTLFIFTALCSCSTDEPTDTNQAPALILKERNGPDNTLNPYDIAGRLYLELTERYIANDSAIGTIQNTIAQIEFLGNAHPDFIRLKSKSYQPPFVSEIQYITDKAPGRIAEIIALSSLSYKGKIVISDYVATLEQYNTTMTDPAEIIDYIIDFESMVLSDGSFTDNDKRILLTTASLARFSYDMKKRKVKRRDRDWDISVGNFLTGSYNGSDETAEAITMSVIAGIMSNQY